jgi:hypothetical protein
MKILPSQADEDSLSALAEEARSMLIRGDYSGLAERFGYALAFDRERVAALEADFLAAARSPFNFALPERQSIAVNYLKPNSAGLFAVLECVVPVADGAFVLLDLVVSGKDEDRHMSVEGISGASE